jgi:hypothetical protein
VVGYDVEVCQDIDGSGGDWSAILVGWLINDITLSCVWLTFSASASVLG